METDRRAGKGLKERAREELALFLLIALYLYVFLGSLTVYRDLISAEVGVSYVKYGFALLEALIIAKVILIGRMFGVSRRFEDRPLIVPVVYKSLFFGSLVVLFSVLERLVEGWVHGKGALGGLRSFGELGTYELAARSLMLVMALVPFFAFAEVARILGSDRLKALFFAKRSADRDAQARSA